MNGRTWLAWPLAVLLAACPLYAQATDAFDDLGITVDETDQPLSDVVGRIHQQLGVPILMHTSTLDWRVSLHAHDERLGPTLELLARQNGLLLERCEDGYRLRPDAAAPPSLQRPLVFEPAPTPPFAHPQRRLDLRRASPTHIAALFGRPSVVTTPDGPQLLGPGRAEPAAPLRDPRGAPHGLLELPAGITSLVGYEPLSALIVTGTPAAIRALEALLPYLDVKPLPFLSEARVVQAPRASAEAALVELPPTDRPLALDEAAALRMWRALGSLPGAHAVRFPLLTGVGGDAFDHVVTRGEGAAHVRFGVRAMPWIVGQAPHSRLGLAVGASWRADDEYEATAAPDVTELVNGDTAVFTMVPHRAPGFVSWLYPDGRQTRDALVLGPGLSDPNDVVIVVFVSAGEDCQCGDIVVGPR